MQSQQNSGPEQSVWSIGLMTGTALDGFVDTALIRTDGVSVAEFGPFELFAYSDADRTLLAEAITQARAWDFQGPEPLIFAEAEDLITRIYAGAVLKLVEKAKMRPEDIAFVGGHGLTVLHRPQIGGGGRTRQLLDGAKLAELTGMDTVWDFRSHDVASGGQGAPLAPIYHTAILRHAGLGGDTSILNLGGVANITWWDGGDSLAAFDTGPANGPLNEWVEAHGQGVYDKDGRLAASGRVHEGRLLEILDNPWFDAPYPKSLDRYDFDAGLVRGLSLEDGAATLTALVAASLDLGLRLLPTRPKRLVVAGGGRKNPVLMAEIAARCGVQVLDADTIGLRGDAIEAECFALLAVRSARGLPLSFPGTTGVDRPTAGGVMSRAG
ncbi:anhydro-N-acetylmuramic acid kinase [Aquidulcibacter paucihalophilus]|uniref:anhydro-N-acetylmuramic acid kinase n=1 Tax=Aquidulcibacter paucihalophilus TaxID=1978549 RepID=UPI000A196CBC|nr:anhydro-N-acetylmuramic acid kinase [Aquidulcibacter paucihalophilus]